MVDGRPAVTGAGARSYARLEVDVEVDVLAFLLLELHGAAIAARTN
jgi:hypothetical protein